MGYTHKYWTCPFYSGDDDKPSVHCEGGSRVKFPDAAAADRYYDAYCANPINWRLCSIAATRLRFYEGREKA